MAKKIFFLFWIAVLAFGYYFLVYARHLAVKSPLQQPTPAVHTPTPPQHPLSKFIFVPYWSDFTEPLSVDGFTRLVYFGLSQVGGHVNEGDQGYKNLAPFVEKSRGIESWLTLRLTDSDSNAVLLKKREQWNTLIPEVAAVAQKNGFVGVMIDLEVSALPTDSMARDITDFIGNSSIVLHDHNLKVAAAVYGDVLYRKRPYDVAAIAKSTDEVMFMAYDLHKAKGEPGPNFPLKGADVYGYDLTTMISEVTSVVPVEKVSVILGMYGYDWVVDEKKRPLKAAESLSTAKIQEQYANHCDKKTCLLRRDELSAETEINVVTSVYNKERNEYDLYPHIIWYEDEESAAQKTSYLNKQGVYRIGTFAYGYY